MDVRHQEQQILLLDVQMALPSQHQEHLVVLEGVEQEQLEEEGLAQQMDLQVVLQRQRQQEQEKQRGH